MAENATETPQEMLQSVRKVLLMMPHLRKVNTLRFGDQMNGDLLSLINELLPELEVLETQCQNDCFSGYQGNVINFKHVNQLTIHISGSGMHPADVPLSFDRLEHLIFDGYSRNAIKWTEFIVQHKQLKTLVLMPGLCIFADENIDQSLMRFAAELPQLAELFVYGDFISTPDCLIQFVSGCQSLTKLQLRFLRCDETIRESFVHAMGSGWSVTKENIAEHCNDLIFERRLQ